MMDVVRFPSGAGRLGTLPAGVIALWCLAMPATAGGPEDDRSPRQPQVEADVSAPMGEGLWPSPRLIELMLSRWSEEAAQKYDLNDEQRARTRQIVVERWTRFLKDHRETLQPLLNEYLELRMELKPPDKARVQEWAKRARPAFEKVRGQMEEGSGEFRALLRPDQRARFELDALQMKVGLGMAQQQLSKWERGEIEPHEFWEPVGQEREARREERRRRRREREAAMAEAQKAAAPADPIEEELDSWQRYVAEFIQQYRLDPGQQTTVWSCLSELRERALAHRDRHREEIDKLERQIAASPQSDADVTVIQEQLARLYGPVDDMFKELQARIEQIPNRDQRASAMSDSAGEAKSSEDQARRPSRQSAPEPSPAKDGASKNPSPAP